MPYLPSTSQLKIAVVSLIAILLLVFNHVSTTQLLAFSSSEEKPVRTLYLHCGNPIILDLPADAGEVSYDIEGAELVQGDAADELIIVPYQANVSLRVLSEQHTVRSYQFQVRRIPLPDIVLHHKGEVSLHDIRIPAAETATLSVHAVPDEDLGRFLPRDARFKLLGTVSLVRDKQVLRSVVLDGSFDADALGVVQTGDEISVTVDRMLRKNFRDEVEEVAVKEVRTLRATIL